MKISICTNKHFLRKIEVFIRFDSFLMYIDIHTKSKNFLKISMFSNKIFTLTSRAQLFEKVKISHKISFFFPKIDSFAQKLMLRKTLVTLINTFSQKIARFLQKIYATWNVNFRWHKRTFLPKYHRIKSYFESK